MVKNTITKKYLLIFFLCVSVAFALGMWLPWVHALSPTATFPEVRLDGMRLLCLIFTVMWPIAALISIKSERPAIALLYSINAAISAGALITLLLN